VSATSTLEPPRSQNLARWLQLLLVLSLSINLLIAGAVFGGLWLAHVVGHGQFEHGPPGHPGPAMAMMGPVGKFVATLTPERKGELREAIKAHQAAVSEFNKAMAGVRHEVVDALLAVPFDHAKFESALKHVYEAEAVARAANVPANAAFVEHLTDAERASFVKVLNWPGVKNTENAVGDTPAETKAP